MLEQEAQARRGKLVMLGAPGTAPVHLETKDIVTAVLAGEWFTNLSRLADALMEPFFSEHPECGSRVVTAFAEEACSLFVEQMYGDTTQEIALTVGDLAWERTPCGNYCAEMLLTLLELDKVYEADYSAFVAMLENRWGVSVDEDGTDREWYRLRHIFNLLWIAVYLAPREGEHNQRGPMQTHRTAR